MACGAVYEPFLDSVFRSDCVIFYSCTGFVTAQGSSVVCDRVATSTVQVRELGIVDCYLNQIDVIVVQSRGLTL